MAFTKMQKQPYPPRLWALVGYAGCGKSTFATQMHGPILPVDADHRFDEVLELAPGDVYQLSDVAADHSDTDRIAALLADNMPGAQIGTIVVDSLTSIIAPLVMQGMQDFKFGRIKNRAAASIDKAVAMRQLQDAVTRWGTDVLWIYHLHNGRDNEGKETVKATVSRTELARLTRSINMQLEVVQQDGKRGIKIVWARRGRSFPEAPILWDESGMWKRMPERIEATAYDGLSKAQQDAIEAAPPDAFPSAETAIAWGANSGAFGQGDGALNHARNAYDKLKRDKQPTSAQEMRDLWVADVACRLKEQS